MADNQYKFIDASWITFRDMVIPEDAPPLQITVAYQAFIAGAGMMFNVVTNPVDLDGEAIDEVVKLTMIERELASLGDMIDQDATDEELENIQKLHAGDQDEPSKH